MSLLQGVGPLRAVASIVLPRSTNVVILGFLMVFSNASVLAVPLLWVSSPDTPLLMLRLFTLLDAANYPAALYISMTVSLFIVSLAGAIVVSINGVGLAAFARKQVAPWR
nr:transporter [Corynebacterium diphtheriae]